MPRRHFPDLPNPGDQDSQPLGIPGPRAAAICPLPRLLGAGPRRAAGLRGLAAVRFAAPRVRGSSCAEGTWRSSRANGRPQKRQVGSARGGWPGAVEGTEQWRARGPFRGHKLGKVDSQPPKFLNIFFQLPTASLFFSPLFNHIHFKNCLISENWLCSPFHQLHTCCMQPKKVLGAWVGEGRKTRFKTEN